MKKKSLTIILLIAVFSLTIASGIHPSHAEISSHLLTSDFPDLGDAPDGKNTIGVPMTAYGSILAKFPTVHGSPSGGPRHANSGLLFHLGATITAEDEADSGFDADGVNNIDPSSNVADQDQGDDGLRLPPVLLHCQTTELQYDVHVYAGGSGQAYVNVWLDYDRNGGWGSVLDCDGNPAPEWAVQNQIITLATPGLHTFTTPSFLVYNPPLDGPMWVRITISESPTTSPTGAAPNGWEVGETEDYLWQPPTAIDLGDAPDSSNSHGQNMWTYGGVMAQFPTVYSGGLPDPTGPLHINTPLRFHLGDGITREDEADIGYDEDTINNINPAPQATHLSDDQDGADDGLTLPQDFTHCDTIDLPFSVRWYSTLPATAYVNLWIDFNRNGRWGDTLNCDGLPVSEWAVQNQGISLSGAPGYFTTNTWPFQVYNTSSDQPMWVRITLSDSLATAADGRGPHAGWNDGETEDYLWIPSYDLEVTGMEVSQGTQNLANDMTLVEDRFTIARVYVTENTGRDVDGVTARLFGSDDTGTPLAGSPLTPDNPGGRITVHPDGGSRLDSNDSFWFFLPRDWREDTVTLRAEVNFDNAIPETDASNNEVDETVTYTDSQPIKVKFVPLHLHEDADRNEPVMTYWCTEIDCDDIRNGLLRYHPLAFTDLFFDIRSSALYPTRHGWPVFKEWDPTDNGDQNRILAVLGQLRLWNADYGWHYYGMAHSSLWTGGKAFRPGKVGIGMMGSAASLSSPWYIGGGRVLAHELGHNLGLKHIPCADSDGDGVPDEQAGGAVDWNYPWPLPDCSLAEVDEIGYYGLDVHYSLWGLSGPEIISNDPTENTPHLGFPLMSYKTLGWVSPWEYCAMLAEYRNVCLWPASDTMTEKINTRAEEMVAALESVDEYLLISGIVDGAGQTVELYPFYRLKGISPEALTETIERQKLAGGPEEDEPWIITLESDAGVILFTYQIIFNVEGQNGTQGAVINDILPFMPDTGWIRVRHAGKIIAERAVSANAPQVKVLTPNSGGQIAAGDVISWIGSDADGDGLAYTILYSWDAGESWTALALDTPLTELTITQNLLDDMPGSDKGTIKVIASDGVNTGEDVPDNTFVVPDAAPQPIIVSPFDGQVIPPETLLVLTGLALDKEDGMLDEAVLEWESSQDGFLGSGSELLQRNPSLGQHVITLHATDSDGNQASSSISIYIGGYKNFLPIIIRGNTAP